MFAPQPVVSPSASGFEAALPSNGSVASRGKAGVGKGRVRDAGVGGEGQGYVLVMTTTAVSTRACWCSRPHTPACVRRSSCAPLPRPRPHPPQLHPPLPRCTAYNKTMSVSMQRAWTVGGRPARTVGRQAPTRPSSSSSSCRYTSPCAIARPYTLRARPPAPPPASSLRDEAAEVRGRRTGQRGCERAKAARPGAPSGWQTQHVRDLGVAYQDR
eukprot:352712-Chlamydomonas_euryale.AAC.4